MAQVQAQAQAQRQKTIAYTESLELVRCLLRVSVFHISFLRGLFPDEHFKGVEMPNLDGMNIRMLLPRCDESKRLIDWVEGGVHDAIRRGYLKALYFGIATDPEGSNLLEEYIFSFKYGEEDGQVTMDLQQHIGRSGAKNDLYKGGPDSKAGQQGKSVEAVKYQVLRLMRMLVQICNTLDRVPSERFIFMKLTYQNHTPEEYEPPYFVAVEPGQGVGHFSRKPFTMEAGRVSTAHHTVTMNVKSTLDCCADDSEGGSEVMEGEPLDPGEQEGMASAGMDGVGPETDVDMDAPLAPLAHAGVHAAAEHGGAAVRGQGGNAGVDPTAVPVPVSAAEYEAVKAFVTSDLQTQGSMVLCDLGRVFVDLAPPALSAVFARMQREGVVAVLEGEAGGARFGPGPALAHQLAAVEAARAADALAADMEGGMDMAGG